MSLINYKIYSPSYKRSNSATSHKLFIPSTFSYVVREEELSKYKKQIPDVEIISIPSGSVKDISTTRNWILNNATSDQIIMVDDDMYSINWCYYRKKTKLNPGEIDFQINNMIQMAMDIGAGLFGMNVIEDPKAYSINRPFQFSQPILGPFVGFLDKSLRYDERLYLKEDYDMFLQQMNKHRKCLRISYLSYSVNHQTMPGGCQEQRTKEKEEEQNRLLQQKWGNDIVRDNYMSENSINKLIKLGM